MNEEMRQYLERIAEVDRATARASRALLEEAERERYGGPAVPSFPDAKPGPSVTDTRDEGGWGPYGLS